MPTLSMFYGIIAVKIIANYKLLVTFENNKNRILDMQPYLQQGVFQELKDERVFSSVGVSFDTIAWSNDIDLDPEFVYDKSSAFDFADAIKPSPSKICE